jgi:acyl carrier protein
MKFDLTKKDILKMLKKMKHTKKINLDSNLITEGLLDSFDIIVLVSQIEKKFKIKIPGDKINLKNFLNVNKIFKLVKNVH